MRADNRTRIGWMAGLVVLGGVGVAAAQNFVWPPQRNQAQPAQTPAATVLESRSEAPPADPAGTASRIPVTPSPAGSNLPVAPAAGGRLDWRILENPNGPHAIMIFDPVRQVFAVYHVDSVAGQIMLKSVRNVAADLRLDQFNSSNPAPKDIQAMLDEAR